MVSVDEQAIAHLIGAGSALLEARSGHLPTLGRVVQVGRAGELLLSLVSLRRTRRAVLLGLGELLEVRS